MSAIFAAVGHELCSRLDLDRLKRVLQRGGPDRFDVVACQGFVGLRASFAFEAASIPRLPSGHLLLGDVRLDRRAEVRSRFGLESQADDLDLFAASYSAGRVEELRGEYCLFAYHEESRCFEAWRDPLGCRPLYVARAGDGWLISNSLKAIRVTGLVDLTLDDEALGRFLVANALRLGHADATPYQHVRMVPPGCKWSLVEGRSSVRAFWEMPLDVEPMRGVREPEVLDQYRNLLSEAIADRVEGRRPLISLSGGLDSTSVACLARELSPSVVAMNEFFEVDHPDPDHALAVQTSRVLDIPLVCQPRDGHRLFDPSFAFEQPSFDPIAPASIAVARSQAERADVVLSGLAGDELLESELNYPAVHAYGWPAILAGYLRAWGFFGSRPSLARLHRRTPRPELATPDWLREQPKIKLDEPRDELPNERIRLLMREADHAPIEDVCEFEVTPIVSAVFADVRLLEFVLRLPPMPYLDRKYVMRRAMSGRLPEGVLMRPKEALGDLHGSLWKAGRGHHLLDQEIHPWLAAHVDVEAVQMNLSTRFETADLLPLSVNLWLNHYASH